MPVQVKGILNSILFIKLPSNHNKYVFGKYNIM
jgi:hypothetical protein